MADIAGPGVVSSVDIAQMQHTTSTIMRIIRYMCKCRKYSMAIHHNALCLQCQVFVHMTFNCLVLMFKSSHQTDNVKKLSRGQHLPEEAKEKLQFYYKQDKYPAKAKKEHITKVLGLEFLDVENWFRYERAKSKCSIQCSFFQQVYVLIFVRNS